MDAYLLLGGGVVRALAPLNAPRSRLTCRLGPVGYPTMTRPSRSKSAEARIGDVPPGGTAYVRGAARVGMAAGSGREERPAPRGAPFRGSQLS